jgi:hypothetical protein
MLLHGLPPSPYDEETSMERFVHALSWDGAIISTDGLTGFDGAAAMILC